MAELDYGLGRLPAKDERDAHYDARKALALPTRLVTGTPVEPLLLPSSKTWTPGPVLDQGQTSQCVAYSWSQFLQTSPIRTKLDYQIEKLYNAAQATDEWPGPPPAYDGTSVRAGAKALTEWGHIAQYLWATDVDTLRAWVLTKGPAVFGTNWYQQMFTPDKKGFVHVAGTAVGGHAYLCIGYSTRLKAFRFINSWGSAWGQKGRFWISEADVAKLIAEDGEVCMATEQVVVAPPAA